MFNVYHQQSFINHKSFENRVKNDNAFDLLLYILVILIGYKYEVEATHLSGLLPYGLTQLCKRISVQRITLLNEPHNLLS